MIRKEYYFYICDNSTSGKYEFYNSCDSLVEANKLVDFLEHKGFNSFWVKDTMGYDYKTNDYTIPIKEYYFDKPLMLINEIANHVIPEEINDLTQAQYAFYEGHITFKKYNEIVKRIQEGEKC